MEPLIQLMDEARAENQIGACWWYKKLGNKEVGRYFSLRFGCDPGNICLNDLLDIV